MCPANMLPRNVDMCQGYIWYCFIPYVICSQHNKTFAKQQIDVFFVFSEIYSYEKKDFHLQTFEKQPDSITFIFPPAADDKSVSLNHLCLKSLLTSIVSFYNTSEITLLRLDLLKINFSPYLLKHQGYLYRCLFLTHSCPNLQWNNRWKVVHPSIVLYSLLLVCVIQNIHIHWYTAEDQSRQ